MTALSYIAAPLHCTRSVTAVSGKGHLYAYMISRHVTTLRMQVVFVLGASLPADTILMSGRAVGSD